MAAATTVPAITKAETDLLIAVTASQGNFEERPAF
jgi:hypothetical protein